MSTGFDNRKFREEMPQRTTTDACPNYCHSETSRKVFRSSRWREVDDVRPSFGDGSIFRPLVGQRRNPILGTATDPDSPLYSRLDQGPGVLSNMDAFRGKFATGGGATFGAFRLVDAAEGVVIEVKLQWESQKFLDAATDWEKKNSPLIHPGKHRPMIPIVDVEGYIIAYSGVTSPNYLWETGDGRIMLIPEIGGQNISDSEAAANLKRWGWKALDGADEAKFITNVDGEVLTFDLSDIGLEAPGFIPSLMLGLYGSLIFSVIKGGIKTLIVRSTIRRSAAKGLKSASGEEMAAQLRRKGEKVVVNLGGTGEVNGALNLNPNIVAPRIGIPNLIQRPGEEIGQIFKRNTVDAIVSNRLPPNTIDWIRLLSGAKEALKPGGSITIAFQGVGDDAAIILEQFRKLGFREIEDVLGKGAVLKAIK